MTEQHTPLQQGPHPGYPPPGQQPPRNVGMNTPGSTTYPPTGPSPPDARAQFYQASAGNGFPLTNPHPDEPGYSPPGPSGVKAWLDEPLIAGKPGPFPPGYRPDERDRPNVMLVWLWLFVFSPVVLFLAPSYARKAKRFGFKETARYWVPFWLTIVGYVALFALIMTVSVSVQGLPHYNSSSGTYAVTTLTQVPQGCSSNFPTWWPRQG